MRCVYVHPKGALSRQEESFLRRAKEQNISVTALYCPNSPSHLQIISLCHRAFPLTDLPLQLSYLNPQIVCGTDAATPLHPSVMPISCLDSYLEVPFPPSERKPLVRDDVALCIRSHNNASMIEQTLTALMSQTLLPGKIVLIDSESTDETLSIASRFPVEIEKIAADSYFPGKVLNQWIENVTQPLLVFLNSDAVLLSPQALENLIAPLSNPEVVGTFARQLPRPDAAPWVVRDYKASFPYSETPPAWMTFSLCHAAIKRSAWEKHPFYETAWASEDQEWGVWAKKHGHKIVYTADAPVMHSHNYTFFELYGRRFVEGEADAAIRQANYPFHFLFWDTLKATLRDIPYYLQKKELLSFLTIPFRRFVYYWAYYRGHVHGRRRLVQGVGDASYGQRLALARHPSQKK